MGKREIGELSIQDFVVSILMAELAAICIEKFNDPISYTLFPIILLCLLELLFGLTGYKRASLERKKGYLQGFIISLILILIFTIITLITSKITFSTLVYYLSLIFSSITGGIIGVSKK